MSWLYSRALVAEYSAASCLDGEPSAPWNLNLTPQAFCSLDKTMEFSRLSRSGMTYERLTESRGEDLLMWYRRDSHAKTYQQRAADADLTASAAGCGEKLNGSFAKWDRDTFSWRTAQRLLLGGLMRFSGTWPRSGSMRNGECWERQTWVPHTYVSESGLLPTLTRRDYRSDKCTPEVKAARDAHPRGKTLPWVLGGLVNPPWAEWFMGWPEGWTELKPLATGKFHEWRLQHGECLEGQ